MRFVLLGIVCLTALQCRDIQTFTTPTPVHGYEIRGTVSTANGVPLDSVEVYLDYYATIVSTPIDTQQVKITDSASVVDISVYTLPGARVRRLFLGRYPVGAIRRAVWDGLDSTGKPAPSGEYFIRYTVDSTIVKEVPTLIYAHLTAMTNTAGEFTITGDHLPVGVYFDMYAPDGSYQETIEVAPEVIIDLRKLTMSGSYSLLLSHDEVTTGAFTIH